jgi:hypothetical protein
LSYRENTHILVKAKDKSGKSAAFVQLPDNQNTQNGKDATVKQFLDGSRERQPIKIASQRCPIVLLSLATPPIFCADILLGRYALTLFA